MGSYITRQQVVELTGLHAKNIRRLEQTREFPRRIHVRDRSRPEVRMATAPTSRNVSKASGKARWHRQSVLDWIAKDEEKVRDKIASFVSLSNVKIVSELGFVGLTAPRGYHFLCGGHHVVYQSRLLRLYSAVWRNRSDLQLISCDPYCRICKGFDRPDITTFTVVGYDDIKVSR